MFNLNERDECMFFNLTLFLINPQNKDKEKEAREAAAPAIRDVAERAASGSDAATG